MNTATTHLCRIGKTGRPLGIADVLCKVFETVIARFAARKTGAQTTATLEAASLRRVADQHRRWSPTFAADLYAAADRHERDAAR